MRSVSVSRSTPSESDDVAPASLRRLRLGLRSVATAPIRRGRLVAVAAEDAHVYARLRCVVCGGTADAELRARLLIHYFDPTCSSAPVELRSAVIRTNAAGDGTVDLVLRVEDVPAAIRASRHGLRGEVQLGAETLYRTADVAVRLD